MRVIGYGMGNDAGVVKSHLEKTIKDGNFEMITDSGGSFDVQKSIGYINLLMILMEGKTGKVVFKSRESLPRGEEQRKQMEELCKHHHIILAFVDEEQRDDPGPTGNGELEVMSFAI